MKYRHYAPKAELTIYRGSVPAAARAINEALRTAYHAIGYKELIPYFENTMPLGECLDKIKQESRRYAKRQLTWFRKNPDIQWIILSKFDKKQEILEKCKKTIANSDLLCYNIS